MCFSAPASFTAGVSLSLIGGASVSRVGRPREVPFAAIPLLFGVQQLAEGVVWLSLAKAAPLAVAKYAFLFFSHVVWPTLVPASIYLIEPGRIRRRMLLACTGVGLVVSTYFLYYLCTESVRIDIVNESIAYVAPHFFVTFIISPYSVATCASCFISSHRFVNFFGIVAFLSAVVAYQFYQQTFVSVWCFFAAVLSVVIYAHVCAERKRAATL